MSVAPLRVLEWVLFADQVVDHIEDYTVPQYGDKGSDPLTEMTPEQCMQDIKKWAARFGTGQRGKAEAQRDMLKIAHIACVIWHKTREEAESE